MSVVEIGSHIFTPRPGYTHHGIYAGDGLVVHYSGLSNGLSAGPVEMTTLDSFLGNQDLRVRKYGNPKYTGLSVVERAKSRIGENNYDLQGNNCEHFCAWAITGRSSSRQVDIVEDFVDVIVPGFLVISLLKTRKHFKQNSDYLDVAKDVAQDVAEIGVKAVLVSVTTPVALPAYVAYKAIKWMIK